MAWAWAAEVRLETKMAMHCRLSEPLALDLPRKLEILARLSRKVFIWLTKVSHVISGSNPDPDPPRGVAGHCLFIPHLFVCSSGLPSALACLAEGHRLKLDAKMLYTFHFPSHTLSFHYSKSTLFCLLSTLVFKLLTPSHLPVRCF
jgi:hypothetical protein